jgi:hypothetical protein
MGRRNREHTVIISFVENNQLQEERIICDNLYEALNNARLHHDDIKSVQVFDCLGIEIHSNNKHILDFTPEEITEIVNTIETIETIENEKVVDEQPEAIKEETIAPKIEIKEEIIKVPKKTATKKSVTKKVTTKKSQ